MSYGMLNWPTFHSMGLLHGGFFSAWLTLHVAVGHIRKTPATADMTTRIRLGTTHSMFASAGVRKFFLSS